MKILFVISLSLVLFNPVFAQELVLEPLDDMDRLLTKKHITCLLEPSMEVNLGAPSEGVISDISVDRGDVISKGQVLAKLSSGVELAGIAFQRVKADYGLRKIQRSQDLRRKQLISSQDLDDLKTDQKLAGLELRQQTELLNLKVIKSPIDGVVVDRYKHPGDLVAQEKILRVFQLDPLHVETVLPAEKFGSVKLNETYQVKPELLKESFAARVIAIDKVIDPSSSTFRVRLALPNQDFKLPSGQRCVIDFSPEQS